VTAPDHSDPVAPGWVTIAVPRYVAALREPAVRAAIVLAFLAVAGFLLLALAWRGSTGKDNAVLQLPWIISGGMVGLALIGGGCGLLDAHLGRREAAGRRAMLEDVLHTAGDLADGIRVKAAARARGRS
jgi:hypothetical protein